jgi:cell division protein FtsQ
MKNLWNKIKYSLIVIFWLLCICSIAVLLGASIINHQNLSFKSIKVNIDESNGMLFLSKYDVINLLKVDQINIDDSKSLDEVNYRKLEQRIENNPYVENAELFVDASGNIQINIKQRTPILRVINNKGVSYYIDEHARKMPLSSKFTTRIPVATGKINASSKNENTNDSVTIKKLFVLASFINRDPFLTSLTEQIIVNNQNEMEIIPRIGNHTILIGDTSNLDEKFKKLKVFYKEIATLGRWNEYSQINLKYANEVYCKKKEVSQNNIGIAAKSNNLNTGVTQKTISTTNTN